MGLAFARRGCTKIFLADISEAGLSKTKELIAAESADVEVVTHITDVTDDTSVKDMVDKCIETFGRIDFACNNAGMAMPNILTTDIEMKAFDKIFDVNVKSVSCEVTRH